MASGATFLGIPGLAYTFGLSGMWIMFCYPLGAYTGVFICQKTVARAGETFGSRSIPEYLDRAAAESLAGAGDGFLADEHAGVGAKGIAEHDPHARQPEGVSQAGDAEEGRAAGHRRGEGEGEEPGAVGVPRGGEVIGAFDFALAEDAEPDHHAGVHDHEDPAVGLQTHDEAP